MGLFSSGMTWLGGAAMGTSIVPGDGRRPPSRQLGHVLDVDLPRCRLANCSMIYGEPTASALSVCPVQPQLTPTSLPPKT